MNIDSELKALQSVIDQVKDTLRNEQSAVGKESYNDLMSSADMIVGRAITMWLMGTLFDMRDAQGNQLEPIMYGIPLLVALALRAGSSLTMDINYQMTMSQINEVVRDNPKAFRALSVGTVMTAHRTMMEETLNRILTDEDDES